MFKKYDIIVVGGGHAGCEAAYASASLGHSVLLITQNLKTTAELSCNPAMGGVAKGQIIREIDALGGMTGILTDLTTLQFRMLNSSKGPAMWSPRAQVDSVIYPILWRQVLEEKTNLSLWQDEVKELLISNSVIKGIKTKMGIEILSDAVVLTNGTFLNGRIHIGECNFSGGRLGDAESQGLSDQLKDYGFEVLSLKTGTPMRVNGRSIDFSKLEEQKGDKNQEYFSFLNTSQESLMQNKQELFSNKGILQDTPTEQRSCYLAYTSEEVHNLLRKGFDKSPMFQGRIQGQGPRYCPSIEDKIERFSGKSSHQLFIEPESNYTSLYYINGFSSSLPLDVQYDALRRIKGFEQAEIEKPGYAIEYDYFSPTQLQASLETKLVKNLFFAGQINGTTGYEEAAAQGLIAGINASQIIKGKAPFVLKRSEAYIGVLIDDLVTKGVDEPYRMFTSRAEYRILLRQDNADLRLTPLSFKLGLASKERLLRVEQKKEKINALITFMDSQSALQSEVNPLFEILETPLISQKTKMSQLLLRPQVRLLDLSNNIASLNEKINDIDISIRKEVVESSEIAIKYRSYIEKEQEVADKFSKYEEIKIKPDFDYSSLKSLSIEARQKLSKFRPSTIGQASRISGVSPSDISVLIIYITK